MAYLHCSCEGNVDSGGSENVPVTAAVSLYVSPLACTLHETNSTCTFVTDAVAGGGFTGSVTGTVTVTPLSNVNNVTLSQGSTAAPSPFSFSLTAGTSTSGHCDGIPSMCYTVTTAVDNSHLGDLVYRVTLDPSPDGKFTIPSGHQIEDVKLTVVQ